MSCPHASPGTIAARPWDEHHTLFGEGTAFTRNWPAPTARACGLIEGAAMALDVTVLDLLWSLNLAE